LQIFGHEIGDFLGQLHFLKETCYKIITHNDLIADINHATPTDGGGTGLCQIGGLEEDPHFIMQFDPLSIGETEEHAVVQHGVQILDPEGVHRSIEAHPVSRVVLDINRALPQQLAGQTVIPLLRLRVVVPVKLFDGDGLGVESRTLDFKIVI
jgi:hypothetical protein